MTTTHIQDRYRIKRLLGTGGFGRVYLAVDERLGRQVAIKELSASRLDVLDQAVSLDLFEREARMLAQLDHPGLTKIWDYFQIDDRAYLVMEYVPGMTLRDLVIARGGPLPDELTIACGLQLCAVLTYLHSRTPPVIFRDLKPNNVMVEGVDHHAATRLTPETLQLKLIDFGVARLFKPEQAIDTMIVGTPGYASPEQYGQGQTDARSDIFSLGATLQHLASGVPPTGLILPPLLEIAPNASPQLARVIARATALNPADRYNTVESLRRDLSAITFSKARPSTGTISPRPTVSLPPVSRAPAPPSSAPPVLIGIVAIVLLAAVFGLGALGIRAFESGQQTTPIPSTTTENTAPASRSLLPGATGQLLYGQCPETVQACDTYITTVVGQTERRLVSGTNNTAAALAPDGQNIAITKNGVIFVGPLSNPLARQVSQTGAPARYPAFSPDGNSLAFVATINGDVRLAVADLVSGDVTYLNTNPRQVGWVTWSRVGLTYAATNTQGGPQDIFVLGDDGVPRNLTNTPTVDEDFPAWSPDNRQLLYTSSVPGQLNTRQIYRMSADGSERVQLTTSNGPHTNAVWSPEGTWIAYISRAGGTRFQIWAMRVDRSDQRQLTQSDSSKFYLTWSK